VYSLEILTSKVTAGVAADIEVKVTKDGESVADIGDDEFFVDGVNTYDVGYDPVNEVYTINGAVVETTDDDVFVEVKTDFATKVGKAKIEAPIPVVVVTPDTITNLYTQTVKVTITDPLTGNPLKATLDVAAPDLYFSVKGDVDAEVTDYALGEDETYRLAGKAMGNGLAAYEFKLTAVPSDTDGNDEIKPEVKIVGIHTEDGDLEVEIPVALGDPVLALDNAKLIMGFANPVQITLKDALGNALPDYAVYYGGSQIGVTDANGGLLYSVVPAATGSVTFKGATDAVHDDAAQYVVARASVAEDVTGPVINVTLPESVTTDVLVITGTVTDDSRVAALYLNNKPVAIIPGRSTTFMYEVQLEMGENVIRIIALDGNGNGSEFVGKITRAVTPAAPAAD
jgi:hypothetical protein